MARPRHLRAAVCLALCLTFAAACGGSPGASGSASPPSATTRATTPSGGSGGSAAGKTSLTPVRIAVLAKSVGFGFLYLAQDLGFFARHGLQAQMVVMKPPAAAAALDKGSVDFYAAVGLGVLANQRGLPFRVVFVSRNHPLEVLVAPDSYKTVSQLRGHVIGVGATLQSPVVAETTTMLQRDGLQPSDYHFVYAGNDPANVALLKSHKLAAASVDVVFALPLLHAGYHLLASSVHSVDYPDGGLVTSQQMIRAKPNVVRDTVAAADDAVRLLANPADQGKVVPHFVQDFHLSTAEAIQLFNLIQPTWSPAGKASAAAMQFEFQTNQSLFHLKPPASYGKVFDTSFVPRSS